MNTSLSQTISLDNINIRSAVHEGVRYYSVVDCVEYLVKDETTNAKVYWSSTKARCKNKGIELFTKCKQLKLPSSDGKMYLTDCATQENIFYIVQYIPSKKSDKFKEAFAKIVNERIEEEKNPELAIKRGMDSYRKRGMSEKWIKTRIETINSRNHLTDTLKDHGIKGNEYAKTTNILYERTFDLNAQELRDAKGLDDKDRLRDNMSKDELTVVNISENLLEGIIKKNNSQGFKEIKEDAKTAGDYGARIREIMEEALGKTIITKKQDLIEEGE